VRRSKYTWPSFRPATLADDRVFPNQLLRMFVIWRLLLVLMRRRLLPRLLTLLHFLLLLLMFLLHLLRLLLVPLLHLLLLLLHLRLS